MNSIMVPINIDGTERTVDLLSERFLRHRVIFLTGEINSQTVERVIAQIQFLEARAPEGDIFLYINNSPGGDVHSGFALVDEMNRCECDIVTIGTGICASMAAFILSCGTKGKRFVTPLSEVMIHQVLGGASGQASDIERTAAHIVKVKKKINTILSKMTGQPIEKIELDCDRDYYMDAHEAVSYGLADRIGVPAFDHDIFWE